MSREMTMKLNQILYQRSKDWLENRQKIGILNMLGGGKPDKDEDVETFDNYLRGHIKTSNKTINIRGFFRVPDVSGGERLMINAEEKEEEEKNIIPQREQKEQVPIRDLDETSIKFPLQDETNLNFPLIPHSHVINYHPFRRPVESSVHVEPSETDYQTIETIKYKTHATKIKTNVTSAEMMNMIMELQL